MTNRSLNRINSSLNPQPSTLNSQPSQWPHAASTDSVADVMRAQAARELPEPAAFRSRLHRRNFQIARDLLFATIQADLEDFLLKHAPNTDEGRRIALAMYHDKTALLGTRN